MPSVTTQLAPAPDRQLYMGFDPLRRDRASRNRNPVLAANSSRDSPSIDAAALPQPPLSYKAAMQSAQASHWRDAVSQHLESTHTRESRRYLYKGSHWFTVCDPCARADALPFGLALHSARGGVLLSWVCPHRARHPSRPPLDTGAVSISVTLLEDGYTDSDGDQLGYY
jgi:hypothetical protein